MVVYKTSNVCIRVSDAEKTMLYRKAAEAGMRVTDYILLKTIGTARLLRLEDAETEKEGE